MNYSTEVWVSFNYGAMRLSFSKTIVLGFAPFYGLTFAQERAETELHIEVVSNDYCDSKIYYDIDKGSFLVNVRNWWRKPVTDEFIDSTISEFLIYGWERQDTTNIDELKALMAAQYARSKP